MQKIAKEIRALTVECIASIGQGHIGGSLSIVDALTVLYFKHMNVDPSNPKKEGRDRLVVSKGHAGPGVYATLARKGYFPIEELYTLNRFGTNLPSHCDMNKTPGVDMTAGSLGQGLSCACGLALGSRLSNDGAYIYCIIGDGESQEGQIWEASMFAAHQKLDNLIVMLDNNKLQLSGYTNDVLALTNPKAKWESFGFFVQEIDGNDINQVDEAIVKAKQNKGKPSMIVLNTIKGKGLSYSENAGIDNHSMPISPEVLALAKEELK
ncbi:MAG: transketolase [Bacilli bacterium]|nr:transketolase [Bacilli bacterium]